MDALSESMCSTSHRNKVVQSTQMTAKSKQVSHSPTNRTEYIANHPEDFEELPQLKQENIWEYLDEIRKREK